jgi:predicted nucleic acid-binding protein
MIQFWDALIIAAASAANCFEVLTEDLNEGELLPGFGW